MKLTQEIIDQIQKAMNHTKKNGDVDPATINNIKTRIEMNNSNQ